MNDRENIKTMVRGFYDLQKLRMQMGNRVVGNFMAKLGQEPGESEDELSPDAKLILNNLRASYRRITDGVKRVSIKNFKGDAVIGDYADFILAQSYFDIEASETRGFNSLEKLLDDFPIYTEFLKDIRGVGPAMAGIIISEIDITKAEYPSSIHKYAGLDVVKGEGRSRKKHHLEESTYIDKEGKEQKKMGITFNPFLKTKLIGVLGTSFLRSASEYREHYDNYKNRLENAPAHKEKTKGHRHNMAVRYMVKRFLIDLYVNWRTLEGLPVAKEYSEAKLGIVHKVA